MSRVLQFVPKVITERKKLEAARPVAKVTEIRKTPVRRERLAA